MISRYSSNCYYAYCLACLENASKKKKSGETKEYVSPDKYTDFYLNNKVAEKLPPGESNI